MKRLSLFITSMLFLSLAPYFAVGQNIYTFAGIAGPGAYAGDGGLATIANLSGNTGVATDAAGNVYIADTRNNVVRMVNTSGVISTFAGVAGGFGGFGGDGGAANAAQLNQPSAVAVDATGNVYIADTRNNAIRVVNTAGVINTFAGMGGTPGAFAGDGGPATAASLNRPSGVAVDASGNIYISDTRNNVIREVVSGTINTVAGNNTAGFGFSGDGAAATAAQLYNPAGITVDGSGNIYIADSRNNVVRLVTVSTGNINTFAGNYTLGAGYTGNGGLATAAQLNAPYDVKLDAAGNVYISDRGNSVVRSVNTSLVINNYAGNAIAGYSGDGGLATAAEISTPEGLAIDASGNVYISSTNANIIRRVGAPVTGITITSNTGDTVCYNTLVSFTATAIAYTATPNYQWVQNGVYAGTDASTFTPATFATGDVIRCILYDAAGDTLAESGNLRIDSMPNVGILNGPPSFCIGSSAMIMDVTGAGGPGGPGAPPVGGTWLSTDTLVASAAAPGLVTGLATGADTIYFILANGCGTDSASLVISVVPNTFGAISGSDSVCAGTTATYTDTSMGGTWHIIPMTGGNTIDSLTGTLTAGFLAGNIVVTYGSSPGCYASDSVTILPRPAVAPIGGATSQYTGSTNSLTDAVTGGTWSSSNTTVATVDASGNVFGLSAGITTISYSITNTLGCTRVRTHQDTVILGEGVATLNNTASFTVYPNPATGNLNITWAAQSTGNGIVTISDVSGRTVYASSIEMSAANHARLDISSLKAGVYMISIQSGSGYYCSKLVVGE